MSRVITTTTTVYSFDELSEAAKQKAIEGYRETGLDDEWYDFVFEDVVQAATILGIEISDRDNGKAILFTGFWSQGDGACFEGYYSYAKGAVKAIKEYAPEDTKLHRIAADLQAVQAKEAYKLEATVKHTDNYHCHYNSVTIDVSHIEDLYRDLKDGSESGIDEALRDFCKWIYDRLYDSYYYLTSDEAIKETIEANEWEYTESGKQYF